jgi:hypothetical protein
MMNTDFVSETCPGIFQLDLVELTPVRVCRVQYPAAGCGILRSLRREIIRCIAASCEEVHYNETAKFAVIELEIGLFPIKFK